MVNELDKRNEKQESNRDVDNKNNFWGHGNYWSYTVRPFAKEMRSRNTNEGHFVLLLQQKTKEH
jgi:hypothetical protein